MPEASRNEISGEDIFCLLPSALSPPFGDLSPRPSLRKERGRKAGCHLDGLFSILMIDRNSPSRQGCKPRTSDHHHFRFLQVRARGWVLRTIGRQIRIAWALSERGRRARTHNRCLHLVEGTWVFLRQSTSVALRSFGCRSYTVRLTNMMAKAKGRGYAAGS